MKATVIAVVASAFAVTVFAFEPVKLEKKQASSFDTNSAFQVLFTALPSSLVSQAITNPNAVSSEIASDFSAGRTPDWYKSLPTDVQTYLISKGNPATATTGTSGATNVPPVPSFAGSGVASTGMMPYGTNGTGPYATGSGTIGTTAPAITSAPSNSSSSSNSTTTSSSSSSSISGPSSSSSRSTGGAAPVPTAAYGAGIGLVAGLVGMLAL